MIAWKEIWDFTYGKCAHCESRNWKLEKTGIIKSGFKKVPTYSRKCLSCNKYNVEKWWVGPVLALFISVPPIFILDKFFPGQIKYPTYISEEVFFIFIPIYFLFILLLMAIFYNCFSANKIIDPPRKQKNK